MRTRALSRQLRRIRALSIIGAEGWSAMIENARPLRANSERREKHLSPGSLPEGTPATPRRQVPLRNLRPIGDPALLPRSYRFRAIDADLSMPSYR
jgi:hypothetical protein